MEQDENTIASPLVAQYFKTINEEVDKCYELAMKARSKGLDPVPHVEVQLAADVASRVEGLVGPVGVADRIRELEKEMEREEIALKIAEEIVLGKFEKLDSDLPNNSEKLADQAVRAALAILTEGITAGPLEGIAKVEIRNNPDGTNHLAIYYAGPIRAAGGTEAAQTVLIGDYIRNILHLDPYSPTEKEVERVVEEKQIYERRITHLQYSATEEQVRFAVKNLPIELSGEPTNNFEVTGYRDLPRITTNQIRGGMVLVLVEGVLGKAKKLLKIVDRIKIPQWGWLKEIPTENTNSEKVFPTIIQPINKYLNEVIAGRPVFGFPMTTGGFRLRYGRSRNTGLAGAGIHPATMVIVDSFLAIGTHIRTERPGKGAIVTPITSIDGPIVKLKNGTVKKISTIEEAEKVVKDVDQIIFLGDLLIGAGEFFENNHPLVPPGYVEEYWAVELEDKVKKSIKKISEEIKISVKEINSWINNPFENAPSLNQAIKLSRYLGIGLHPKYLFFWENLNKKKLNKLRNILLKITDNKTLSISNNKEIKEILEEACIPHSIENSKITFEKNIFEILLQTLGIKKKTNLFTSKSKNSLDILSDWSKISIRRKAGIYIGARMGRPEKAKERKMSPPVHGLFPIQEKGGPQRNIVKAAKASENSTSNGKTRGIINPEVALRICTNCGENTPFLTCPSCNNRTRFYYKCSQCNNIIDTDYCPNCKIYAKPFMNQEMNLDKLYRKALNKVNRNSPKIVKGVKGMTSGRKIPETLEKAILRSIHDVYVFKDGTIRFDSTNAPLTHFTPEEAQVDIKKLKELGYLEDYLGNALTKKNQILELKIQDIILPITGADYLIKVADFIDDLLQNLYDQKPYYQITEKNELVGHLTMGLAPHTSAGIVGRIVGFTNAQVGYAHPYWHAAKRRNADSDEDSLLLLLDVLLNFSKEFLPARRGGMMDAPLVFSPILDPSEVDDESWNVDVGHKYPLEFYEAAKKYADPKSVDNLIERVEKRIGKPEQYEGFKFTHPTERYDIGPTVTTYKTLKTMEEKLNHQLIVCDKIKAVNAATVAGKIISSHFIPDIVGCLRTYTRQTFRCVKCNIKYRRPPLKGVCTKCGGEIILTVSEGTVKKYINITRSLIDRYDLTTYYKQRVDMLEEAINTIFVDKEKDQVKLDDFFK
ncbi:MAG: DNA polymerase II large subunit [Candidatus Ranarchaeia archaeon]